MNGRISVLGVTDCFATTCNDRNRYFSGEITKIVKGVKDGKKKNYYF
jgi:hypothetical protein